jgi:hypothetical protein
MPKRLALTFLLVAGTFWRASAQDDGPIKMNPELALAIPLLMVKHDVTVKYPILINRTTVVKPGMILRNLYIPPTNEDSENLALAHKGDMEEAYSRPVASSADDGPKIPPEIAHELERQRRVVWEVPINFQLALAQLPTENLHLIFSTSGDNRNLDDERLNFYDGLFLGSPSGGTTVLAVEIGSKAEEAGFKPGDKILSIGGIALPDDLAAFPQVYFTAKEAAKENRATTFPFVVQSAGQPGTRTLNLALPPAIKSLLMEGF